MNGRLFTAKIVPESILTWGTRHQLVMETCRLVLTRPGRVISGLIRDQLGEERKQLGSKLGVLGGYTGPLGTGREGNEKFGGFSSPFRVIYTG